MMDVLLDKASLFIHPHDAETYPAARHRLLSKTHEHPQSKFREDASRLIQSGGNDPLDRLEKLSQFRHLVAIHYYVCDVLGAVACDPQAICDFSLSLLPRETRNIVRLELSRPTSIGTPRTLEDVLDLAEKFLNFDREEHEVNRHGTYSNVRTVHFEGDGSRTINNVNESPLRCNFCGKPGSYGRVCSCPAAVKSRQQREVRVPVNDPSAPPLTYSAQRSACYSCGEIGHIRSQCPRGSRKIMGPYTGTNRVRLPSVTELCCPFCQGRHPGRFCEKNPNKPNTMTCNYCGNRGHLEASCRIRANDGMMIHNVNAFSGNDLAVQKTQNSQ